MDFDLSVPLRLTADSLAELQDRTDPETSRSVWREAQARALARSDPLILATYVVRTAYRLVRELARTMGTMGEAEAVSNLSLTTAPERGAAPMGQYSTKARALLVDAALPLHLLPTTPEACFDGRTYSALMRQLSIFLCLDTQEYSSQALPYLLQTPPEPRNWPTPGMLYAYETNLVDEVLGSILENGTRNTEYILRQQYGLLTHEARGLVKMAKFDSRERIDAEVEEDRALLTMRLEDLIKRARESFDLRAELGANKQLAIVLGVTRIEPADVQTEFANVVRKVANTAPKELT